MGEGAGMEALVELANRWREQAAELETWGANEAKAVRRCAEQLEVAIREWQLEALTLKEAELESGYSYSALQGMVANGIVPNAGTRHKPLLYRCDTPKKAGRRSAALMGVATDLADEVLAAG